MIPEQTSLSDPVEKKIAWARAVYEEWGKALLQEKGLTELINRLKSAVAASRREMAGTGIVEICTRCDRDEGGSCCGEGLEYRYDGWIILINLLMGVSIPRQRLRQGSCFFLGEEGCVLLARHVICINYLCRKITGPMEPASLTTLRETEEEEIKILFILHEEIKRVLKRWTTG